MGYQTTVAVLQASQAKGSARLVLMVLAHRANEKQEHACWPGIERLARECGMSERSTQRALRSLEALGEIKIEQGGKGRFDTNTYWVTVRPPETPIVQVKGDNGVTLRNLKGDNSGTLRVSDLAVKGDNGVTQIERECTVELKPEYTHTRTGDLHDSRAPIIRVDPSSVSNAQIDRVVGFLNSQLGTTYVPNLPEREKITLAILTARGDLAGMERAIKRQILIWGPIPTKQNFLRPANLFAKELFPSIYAERDAPVSPAGSGFPGRPPNPVANRIRLERDLERLLEEFRSHEGNPDSASCLFFGAVDPVAKKGADDLERRIREKRRELQCACV